MVVSRCFDYLVFVAKKEKKRGSSPTSSDQSLRANWVSMVAQMVKNLPERQEWQVQSLGGEDPLEGNGNPL